MSQVETTETQSGGFTGFLGGLVNAFKEVRIADTQAELEALKYQSGTVTVRPESQIDLSAASVRNTFGPFEIPEQKTMINAAIFLGVGVAAFFVVKKLL